MMSISKRKRLCITALTFFMIGIGTTAHGAEYPSNKPIRVIVPFPPGSATTAAARIVIERMSSDLGQSFIVENKAGAFGQLGTNEIALANPDGYTIGWCNDGPIATVTAGRRKAGKEPPYDYRSFTPIARIGYVTFVLVVRSDLPITSMAALVDYAKKNRGKVNAASAHPTGTLSVALLNKGRGVDIADVRYWSQGEPDGLRDLLRGDVQVMFSTLFNARPHLESGAARALGVLGTVRSSLAPDIPTLVEVGFPEYGGVVGETWGTLCGPRGMPSSVVEKLRNAANASIQDPAVVAKLAHTGWAARGSSASELEDLFRSSEGEVQKLLEETGVQIFGK